MSFCTPVSNSISRLIKQGGDDTIINDIDVKINVKSAWNFDGGYVCN